MVFFIIISCLSLVTCFWISGIDYMQKNHSDYKGEDFLNSDE